MADVFISYHEKSTGELAQQIADALESASISCWVARRDTLPGGDFAREIPSQIDACRVFLLLLNDSVYRSSHIESELGLAFNRYNNREDIKILPLEIGAFQRESWVRYYLMRIQIIPFPAQPDAQQLKQLIAHIAKLLNYELPPPPAQISPSPKITQRGKCGDNVTYTLDKSGVLTISGSGPMADYVYNIKKNAISTPWWDERQFIVSVRIQDGVTSIGEGAFSDCVSLTDVTIPDSVTSIHDMAFYHCAALKNVVIPDSVTFIGEWAFNVGDNLEKVSIPMNAEISFSAFPAITTVTRRSAGG